MLDHALGKASYALLLSGEAASSLNFYDSCNYWDVEFLQLSQITLRGKPLQAFNYF